jgi:hypothetical protein
MAASVLVLAFAAAPASADPRLLPRLNEEQRELFLKWKEARSAYDRVHEAYWATVNARRVERRRKISAGERATPADYVMAHPPKYHGPQLRADIAKLMAELAPPPPPVEITTLPEMLAAARQHYRFAPTIIPEREFKRRYAAEALAVGLTREEVTRIYAFETGGRGTFDMQAGINPDTRQGRAISTAMGYAQLLAANSIDEIVRYGDGFISRLSMIAARPGTPPERVREITAKIEALRAMMRVGRSVPREWSRHVELSRTPPGYGIHVLNLDGDIGPWLQVIKLKGIKDTAEQAGRAGLSPAELELMNLAGPRTGLEMMEPVGRTAPTSNFFAQAAYYRNTVVRDKTAAELLATIDERMNESMKRPGSQEFVAAFDEVARQRPTPLEGRQQLMPGPVTARPQPNPGPVRTLPPPSVPVATIASTAAPKAAPVVSPVVVPSSPPPAPVQLAPMRVTPAAEAAPLPASMPAPMPVLVERRPPPREPAPAPLGRMQWAPPGFADRLPTGFPQ